MVRRFTRNCLPIFALLSLTVSLHPARGLVLCMAEDGHATLELAHPESDCVGDAQRHHPDERSFAADELKRHPCVDVALPASQSYRAPKAPSCSTASLSFLPAVPFAVSNPAVVSLPTRSESASLRGRPQSLLRSVILVV